MRPKRARPAATADDSDCPAPKRPAETPPEQGLAPRAPAAAPPPAQNPTPNSPPATTIEIISQSDGDSDVAPFPGDVGGGSDSDGSGALEAGGAAEGSGGSAKPAVEPNGPAIELGDASLDLEAARASLRKIHATLSRGATAKASTPGDDDEAPIEITDAQADLVFRSPTLASDQVNPNEPGPDGRTPLFIAAENGHPAVVKTLLAYRPTNHTASGCGNNTGAHHPTNHTASGCGNNTGV